MKILCSTHGEQRARLISPEYVRCCAYMCKFARPLDSSGKIIQSWEAAWKWTCR